MDSFEAGLKKSYHTCWGPYIHVGDHMIPVPYKVRGTHSSGSRIETVGQGAKCLVMALCLDPKVLLGTYSHT